MAGAGASSSSPDAGLAVHRVCAQTQCDIEKSTADAQCSTCKDLCYQTYGYCDVDLHCHDSCQPYDCSQPQREACVRWTYDVPIPFPSSAELKEACAAAFAHLRECGSKVYGDCSTYSRSEVPERASNYTCVSAIPCGGLNDQSIAACFPAPSTYGDDVCAAYKETCNASCDAKLVEKLNNMGAWDRPEVLDLGRACLKESCNDVTSCFRAVLAAAEPE